MDDKTWAEITAKLAADDGLPREALPLAHERGDKMQPRGAPFAKGVSGNPGGRPPGARNRATLLAQEVIDARSRDIADKAVGLALEGNALALKLCLERVLPRQREPAIALDLPQIATLADCNAAVAALVEAAATGEVTLHDARRLSFLIENRRRVAESEEFDRRLCGLEAKVEARKSTAAPGRW